MALIKSQNYCPQTNLLIDLKLQIIDIFSYFDIQNYSINHTDTPTLLAVLILFSFYAFTKLMYFYFFMYTYICVYI